MVRTMLGQSRDPVCGAWVPEDSHPWTHLHIKYAFCSPHCRERFRRWPHLYVGEATYGLAEKQQGRSVRKAHRIKIAEALPEDKVPVVRESIESLKGVEQLDIRGDEIFVVYDLVQVSLGDIEEAIVDAATDLSSGISDRLWRAAIHYSEECELDNLAHLASHYRP